MKKLLLNAIAFCLVVSASAQIKTPSPSPTSELKQTVGLTDVTITYSRPGVKDRTVFSKDGLVPYGKAWRTGANSATKIAFSDDVKLGGQALKAGEYAVLTTPNEKEWKFMLYPYESGNWSSYTEKSPAATISAMPKASGRKVESFTIDVNNLRNNGANIDFIWDNTLVSVPLEVEVDKRVMADIERVMAGPSANDYYAAATYMHESAKDNAKALEYVQKANSMGEARFWMLRREALILADLGRKKEAIQAAQKSLDLAQTAGNEEYVTMNKKSIEEWSK
jgi:tetratricopeptide (TPR) repeat protein